jgi:hypothetical protein
MPSVQTSNTGTPVSTEQEAREQLQSWLDNHTFSSPVTINDDMTSEDETGFTFVLYQSDELARIRVTKANGALLWRNQEGAYNSIDSWYARFGDISAQAQQEDISAQVQQEDISAQVQQEEQGANNQSAPVMMYNDDIFNSYGFGVEVPDFYPFTSYEKRNLNANESNHEILEAGSGLSYTYRNGLAPDGLLEYCVLLEGLGFVEKSSLHFSKDNVGVSIYITEELIEVAIFYDYSYPDEHNDYYDHSITFNDLARFPDDYNGTKVVFTGSVVQVIERSDSIGIRLATKYDQYGRIDDIIYVYYDKPLTGGRILNDDIITVYGVFKGLERFESIIGVATVVPRIDADRIDQ